MELNGNAPLSGKALRVIRLYLQLTMAEVAAEMKSGDRSYLCRVETGKIPASEDKKKQIRSAMLKAARKRQRLIGSRLKELELTA